jgi:hypothetical protein
MSVHGFSYPIGLREALAEPSHRSVMTARLVDAGPLQAAWSWPKQTT